MHLYCHLRGAPEGRYLLRRVWLADWGRWEVWLCNPVLYLRAKTGRGQASWRVSPPRQPRKDCCNQATIALSLSCRSRLGILKPILQHVTPKEGRACHTKIDLRRPDPARRHSGQQYARRSWPSVWDGFHQLRCQSLADEKVLGLWCRCRASMCPWRAECSWENVRKITKIRKLYW